MSLPPGAVTVELAVPFHDVDGLHVVWHGHYVKYLEIARMELMRRKRLDVPDLIELGLKLMVAETTVRHSSALRFNDRVAVSVWLTETELRLEYAYELRNLTTGRRAATARSVLVTVGPDDKLCFATPAAILERLAG